MLTYLDFLWVSNDCLIDIHWSPPLCYLFSFCQFFIPYFGYQDERCSKLKIYSILQKVLHLLLHTICIDQSPLPFSYALVLLSLCVLVCILYLHIAVSDFFTSILALKNLVMFNLKYSGLSWENLEKTWNRCFCRRVETTSGPPSFFRYYFSECQNTSSDILNILYLCFLQKALLPDNFTVLDHAMIEYNLLSASKLYKNIR